MNLLVEDIVMTEIVPAVEMSQPGRENLQCRSLSDLVKGEHRCSGRSHACKGSVQQGQQGRASWQRRALALTLSLFLK